jgi:hypothetical protein
MHPSVQLMLRNPRQRQAIERALAARGTHGDTLLAHLSPAEALMLRRAGGAGTINPRTGLPQFYVGGGPGGLAAGGDTETGRQAADRNSGGGFGNAASGHDSGLGAGGGHSGNNFTSQNPRPAAPTPAPAPAPAYASNMPPAAPVATAPLMSLTPSTDLTGGRFGAVPSWAMTPYQVGTAPTSYPMPGVNTSVGLPGGGTSAPAGSASGGAGTGGGNPGNFGGLGGLGGYAGGAAPAAGTSLPRALTGSGAQPGGGIPQPSGSAWSGQSRIDNPLALQAAQALGVNMRNWGANPDENKALAQATGYQGDFGHMAFQNWLATQPASVQHAAAIVQGTAGPAPIVQQARTGLGLSAVPTAPAL